MLSLVLFFLLISSGGVYAAVRHGRRYEEAVPLTIFCGVEVMFLFGLADSLKLGVWAVCAIAAALYALSAREFRRQWKDRKKIYERLFTPAFFIFLLLLVIYAFCIVGRAAYQNDEFSFWATSVKKMWYSGKFACAIEKYLVFIEYPPGMQLIQYFIMMLRGEFTDWRLNFAYVAYVFTLFLPFLKDLRFRRIPMLVLIAALIFCSGTIIYPDCLDNLQVDFALGATFAYGVASLFFLGEEDGNIRLLPFVNIIMAANMLVLIKSAGMLLAVILLVTLLISAGVLRAESPVLRTSAKKRKTRPAKSDGLHWKRYMVFAAGMIFPIVTSRLWKAKYSVHLDLRAPEFNTGNYDILEFIQILLSRTDGGYRSQIKSSFISFLVTEIKQIGFLSLTNIQIVLLLAALFFLICYVYRGYGSRRVHNCTVCILFCFELVYWLGLLCSYMYTFSMGEGMGLASMQRYLNIYHAGVLLCLVFLVLRGYSLLRWDPLLFCAVLVTALSLSSMRNVRFLLARDSVRVSIASNQTAQDLAERLPPADGNEERGLLLVYKQTLPHIPVNRMRYLAYDGYNVPWECLYGSQAPESEGGYTHVYTTEEFHQHISDLGIDYIALENLDEDFISTYGSLFNAPLANGQIYLVPEEGGLFELISSAS